jgi:uncharacterized membrane-anchored protein
MSSPTASQDRNLGHLLNKVPEVTIWFWIIKVLCTTVGETFADYINETLGFGLTNTTLAMTAALVVAITWQFKSRKYRPFTYWLVVVLVSVVGTLVTDNLTDRFNVSLKLSTSVFVVILGIVFAVWYKVEGTMSIHSIRTQRREVFYWLSILFTFALGTAAGDLISEQFNLGYAVAVGLFAGAIALVILVHYVLKLNAVVSFWAAYILTRPLGGSIGDYLSQAKGDGGLGLGTTGTSIIFLVVIAAVVLYLTKSRVDVLDDPA